MDEYTLKEKRYDVELDYVPYLIDPASYRVLSAPTFGTRFATGQAEYQNLDFWQISGLTDFSKGMGQEFLVDRSRYFLSEGIDPWLPGEIKLERKPYPVSFPTGVGRITAWYRTLDRLFLGTDTGRVISTDDGLNWTVVLTDNNKIYQFFELGKMLWLTKGPYSTWCYSKLQKTFSWPLSNFNPNSPTPSVGLTHQVAFFIPTVSSANRLVTLVRILMRRIPNKASSEMVLDVYEAEDDGKPKTDKAIAQARRAYPSNIKTFEYKYFKFPETVELDTTKKYVFVLKCLAGAEESIQIAQDTNGGYPAILTRISTNSGETWTDYPTDSIIDFFNEEAPNFSWQEIGERNLYYVSVESDEGYGLFDDGVRLSKDGFTWTPEPPDPLWTMPQSEGISLNAITIPRGFLIGTARGLWLFGGGGSGTSIWQFPGHTSNEHFSGMSRAGHLAVFGLDKLGIFYTDGISVSSTVFYRENPVLGYEKCRSIIECGQNLFALIRAQGNWWLARSDLRWTKTPFNWSYVKKLTKTPQFLSAFSISHIFIHYQDGTVERLDMESGPYQETGYLITSKIDEGLIKLQKLYRSISFIKLSGQDNSTVRLSYSINEKPFIDLPVYKIKDVVKEGFYILENPSLGNNLQIKITLTLDQETPVLSDLCWKYILERPVEDVTAKKTFTFTILARDEQEDYQGDPYLYNREQIIANIWNSKSKKEILNFVGFDNCLKPGFLCQNNGTNNLLFKIDQVNYRLLISNEDGVLLKSFSTDQSLSSLIQEINSELDYLTCSLHPDAQEELSAKKLMPVANKLVAKDAEVHFYAGTEIYNVIFTEYSPQLSRFREHAFGETYISLTLREI